MLPGVSVMTMAHPNLVHDGGNDDDSSAVFALLHQRIATTRNGDTVSIGIGVFPDNVVFAADEDA